MTEPSIQIVVDGRSIAASSGTTLAAALLNAGVDAFRQSVDGLARGPVCAMGTCHECRVTLDGMPHVRACLVDVRPGMRVETRA